MTENEPQPTTPLQAPPLPGVLSGHVELVAAPAAEAQLRELPEATVRTEELDSMTTPYIEHAAWLAADAGPDDVHKTRRYEIRRRALIAQRKVLLDDKRAMDAVNAVRRAAAKKPLDA